MTSEAAQELTSYIYDNYTEANANSFLLFSQELLNSSLSDDIHELPISQRFKLARSVWHSFSCRDAGEDKVVFETRDRGDGLVSVVHIITDDKPFIVDSLTELLLADGHRINVCLHPVVNIEKSNSNKLVSFSDQPSYESVIYLELTSQLDNKTTQELRQKIIYLLSEINAATNDWTAMIEQAQTVCNEQVSTKSSNEVDDFLQWLCHDHFIFLGYYPFEVSDKTGDDSKDTGLGIFRNINDPLTLKKSELKAMTKELGVFIDSDLPLLISKSNVKSRIHRSDYYDLISVKQFSADGNLVAVHRFIGLFTQLANSLNPASIPYLKFKLDSVLQRVKFKPNSHNYKKFKHILEALPKRELFESDAENLFGMAKDIYNLNDRSKCGTFIRESSFNQQVSVLVFVSKDVFCTDLRDEIEAELCHAYNGKILSRHSMLNDNAVAQWHFILVKGAQQQQFIGVDQLISRIEAKTTSWSASLNAQVFKRWGDNQGNRLIKKYSNGFSKSYRERFSATDATTDIEQFEKLSQDDQYQFKIYRSLQDQENIIRLNIYSPYHNIALSDSIPILENLGFRPLDEFSFRVLPDDCGNPVNDLYTYTLEYPASTRLDLNQVKQNLEHGLAQIWAAEIENDGYNKLLVPANINIRQIVIIRAYGKYLRQLGLGYSEEYFQQALIAYPEIVRGLISLFERRFALDDCSVADRTIAANEIKDSLLQRLNEVKQIDHDRILRNFIAAISATVRTNFYQKTKLATIKSYCSFKIRSTEIDDAPLPRPYVETFVYSPRVEGVHLRFGPVSRGGLRWSDRAEDFRTEVLGLVKAQQVKNVVIVPQGAKGGFVPKQLPVNGSRELITKEAIACYQIFISALLDLTDNNTAEGIVKPLDVVCFDGDDSHLVVAADKGTATFSDIANELANQYDFWLGDAFASGGSVGYDHKKMGITAKGAWVSVQRHFREMGTDVQHDEISVIGIGDMSGDVFGNGLLCSRTLKLVAAFDHRDIFIDPDPAPTLSYDERERLYQLPRSSWNDYDSSLISTGGGVYSRSLKKIPLQPEVKQLLNIDASVDSLSPDQLIRCILKSQADLLWFGGIGTYVKASLEVNTDVGDKNNDALRINGNELRCQVIGEGGNLGCTQLARIEFAKAGGRINTDAVDNSAGVNCSDNEVNIKILLNRLVTEGVLTKPGRDALLEDMTADVSKMVLRNNYYQVQALSLDEAASHSHFDSFTRLTHYLVNSAQLNRELEYLPDDEELQARSLTKNGLTRPELSVLMAYSKMDVHDALLQQQELLEDAYFEKYLLAAFPDTLVKQYSKFIVEHPLAKQIIATAVANEIFNRGGIHAVREQTGATISEIAKAFIVVKEIFKLDAIWNEIESLEGIVSAQLQIKMMIEVQRFYRLMAIWFINHSRTQDSIQDIVQRYSPGISILQQLNDAEITLPFSPVEQSLYQLEQEANSPGIVDKIHQLKVSSVVFCDIVKTAFELDLPVAQILPCYSKVSKLIGLSWLIEQTDKIDADQHWPRLALFSLLLDLLELREKLVVTIANAYQGLAPDAAIDEWAVAKDSELRRVKSVIDDLKTTGQIDIDRLYFANRQLRTLLS